MPQNLEEFKNHKTRIKFIPILDPEDMNEVLEKAKELSNELEADKEG